MYRNYIYKKEDYLHIGTQKKTIYKIIHMKERPKSFLVSSQNNIINFFRGYLIYELQNATSLPISPPDSAKAELYDRAFESTKRAVVAPPMTNESRAVIDILESCGFTVPDSVALVSFHR